MNCDKWRLNRYVFRFQDPQTMAIQTNPAHYDWISPLFSFLFDDHKFLSRFALFCFRNWLYLSWFSCAWKEKKSKLSETMSKNCLSITFNSCCRRYSVVWAEWNFRFEVSWVKMMTLSFVHGTKSREFV